jgi:hypothetical protein
MRNLSKLGLNKHNLHLLSAGISAAMLAEASLIAERLKEGAPESVPLSVTQKFNNIALSTKPLTLILAQLSARIFFTISQINIFVLVHRLQF